VEAGSDHGLVEAHSAICHLGNVRGGCMEEEHVGGFSGRLLVTDDIHS